MTRLIRVIDGRRYNTYPSSTAVALASNRSTTGYIGDSDYFEESLYRTNKGNYFLCGSGGPHTKYRQPGVLCRWTRGENIFPLTNREALAWCESTNNVDAIGKHLPDLVEDA